MVNLKNTQGGTQHFDNVIMLKYKYINTHVNELSDSN